MSAARAWLRRHSAGATVSVVVVATVAAVVLAGAPPTAGPPLDPSSVGPLGTKALVDLLGQLGARVNVTPSVPQRGPIAKPASRAGPGAALVLVDNLDPAARRRLVSFARAGGTLVVADPTSKLTGTRPLGRVGSDQVLSGCPVPSLRQVRQVQPGGGDTLSLPPSSLPRGALGCFRHQGHPWLVERPDGAGTVIALGGPGALTNANLGRADNAVLAAVLLAPHPGSNVVLLTPPPPGSGKTSLLGLVGPRVRWALVQLGLAFVVLAGWRARRLGRPVPEAQPVQIEGCELVRAVGALLRRARHPEAAAALVRAGLRQDLVARLGVDQDAAAVAEVLTRSTALPPRVVALALGDQAAGDEALTAGPDATDAQLVSVAQAVAAVRREMVDVR